MTPALFLDRDGTVTEELGPLVDPARLRLLQGSAAAIRRARAAGFAVVLVTNQSAVARGLLSEAGLAEIHRRLRRLLQRNGAELDGIYHCPHHPEHGLPERCACRKPRPGLLLRAADELALDLGRSWTIGDRRRDLDAGRAAGTSVLGVLTGYGSAEFGYPTTGESGVAADLGEAVQWILGREDALRRARHGT